MNPRTPSSFAKLPKFIIGNHGERKFLMHCHWPRFVMEFFDLEGAVPAWIDRPTSALAAAKLTGDAVEYYRTQTCTS
jgi:hypothetical protein